MFERLINWIFAKSSLKYEDLRNWGLVVLVSIGLIYVFYWLIRAVFVDFSKILTCFLLGIILVFGYYSFLRIFLDWYRNKIR
mgnify:CR=1 FL=1